MGCRRQVGYVGVTVIAVIAGTWCWIVQAVFYGAPDPTGQRVSPVRQEALGWLQGQQKHLRASPR